MDIKPNIGAIFGNNGETDSNQHEKQGKRVQNLSVVNVEEPRIERQNDGHGTTEKSPLTSLSERQVASERLLGDCNDFEDDNNGVIVDTIENEPSRDSEPSLFVPKWLQTDEAVPLWVKWRGTWKAGIRCARADWPLATLRAKPTHGRKNYFVIFFPHTKNYSWADMTLVRSIHEFPQPNACRTHKIGLKMVRDLNVGRRFIMKKLVIGMLNVVEQFHQEALVDTARDVTVWKEFAMEAAHSSGYSDLGKMLLKLQKMILPRYINSNWLQLSFHSWAQRCQLAKAAESIELLKEELSESVLWHEVNSLSNTPMQQTLGPEWKTWKHDVMKRFSRSQTVSSITDAVLKRCENPSTSPPGFSKRPKLEIRRHSSQAETTNPLQPMPVETGPGIFSSPNSTNATSIAVDTGARNSDSIRSIEKTPVNDPGNKNRHCIAFIEAKGRQCVRWANDGDVYCCVHLASRFFGSSSKAQPSPRVDSPICGGTTVFGKQCKHRSLPGSFFCKKHGPRIDPTKTSHPPLGFSLKRKRDEDIPESSHCRDMVLVGQVETPLLVEPLVAIHERNNLDNSSNSALVQHCIGSSPLGSGFPCREFPKRYSLYCDMHLPSWLKRARDGKSRIIPKEVFIQLLKDCYSLNQKLCLHKACELFYKLFKSIMSLRNPVPMEVQLQWALSEASKEPSVGELLLKLVSTEKARLAQIWGFGNTNTAAMPLANEINLGGDKNAIHCKFCLEKFRDDRELASHCVENHKKKAQWLFWGHACAICLDSFTNRKLLETHVQERHHVQFVEQCTLLRCIPCGCHFGNPEELWRHVLAVHPTEFRMSKVDQLQNQVEKEPPSQEPELGNTNPPLVENNTESFGGVRKFVCRFCSLKFDLLPDLGRHHQAAHMGANILTSRPPLKRGSRYLSYQLKSGRLSRHGLKRGPYNIQNRVNPNLKKRIQAPKSINIGDLSTRPVIPEPEEALRRLANSQHMSVANMLFSDIQKAKTRPNHIDILNAARVSCCKVGLNASLEEKFGVLPERFYLKAAKLCSEHNVIVQWHQDGFVCPKGCKSNEDRGLLLPLMPRVNPNVVANLLDEPDSGWEVDESHYVIDLPHFREIPKQEVHVLCKDLSFGKESIPIACVVDEDLLADFNFSNFSVPWESFTYITRPLLDQSRNPEIENLQLGCACPNSSCLPERCDHVYLFDNDFEDALDTYGRSMCGRFPYDNKGRLILEEGYLVYECNRMCRCPKTCPNRVLQNGLRVKIEVFKTENKGWGVRACEPILRGTFVCEYIGEILDEEAAIERRGRYAEKQCSYMYGIDAHANDMSRLTEENGDYVIDATKYGNISRFINHSCKPNLVNHQVLVDSMESKYAHIGLYASRDIMSGEELTHNYRYKLILGQDGVQCQCGTSKCRGRLY